MPNHIRSYERIRSHYKSRDESIQVPNIKFKTPEHSLCCAVLEQALNELVHLYIRIPRTDGDRYARKLGERAHKWIMTDDTQHPFSFLSIVHVFDLNAEAIRRQILRTYGPIRYLF